MSEEEIQINTAGTKVLAAEYKDGQLQIVEVTPFNKEQTTESTETHILSDLQEVEDGVADGEPKYILDPNKGIVQLDLLNLTLVRCDEESGGYRLVAGEAGGESVACVLQSDDGEVSESEGQETYVVMEGEQGPVVILKSTLEQAEVETTTVTETKKQLTPAELIEKAKQLQKNKALLARNRVEPPRKSPRGRKRASTLPPPHELLATPGFKLYLYSCKLCRFQCNAVKDMTIHKAKEHGGIRGRAGRPAPLQCARCPTRANTHAQLMKHVQDKHADSSNMVCLSSLEVASAEVLVCGACGFECGERELFRQHLERDHRATTC